MYTPTYMARSMVWRSKEYNKNNIIAIVERSVRLRQMLKALQMPPWSSIVVVFFAAVHQKGGAFKRLPAQGKHWLQLRRFPPSSFSCYNETSLKLLSLADQKLHWHMRQVTNLKQMPELGQIYHDILCSLAPLLRAPFFFLPQPQRQSSALSTVCVRARCRHQVCRRKAARFRKNRRQAKGDSTF